MTEIRPIEDMDSATRRMVRLALRAKKRAYAPYSRFQVGCCLVDANGKPHTGCNVENASYSATICAERVAVGKMLSRGSKEIKKIIVLASSEEPCFPCGVCLQVLSEFGPKATVFALNGRGTVFREAKLTELFPMSFTREKLNY